MRNLKVQSTPIVALIATDFQFPIWGGAQTDSIPPDVGQNRNHIDEERLDSGRDRQDCIRGIT
eukprot:scaffold418179_cov17-Prasinocladus_malaysianus.AAC.1